MADPAGDRLLVGRVARTHGNRGQVIVNPETDFPEERFRAGATLLVGPEQGPLVAREIRSVRFHQGRPILGLAGIETMNDAEALAGMDLWVPDDAGAALPPGTFYRHDLRGCEVVTAHGAVVGRVADVDGTLERSWLVVNGRRGEVLVPLVEDICLEVDVAGRRIVIAPPEGLLELNERS